MHIMFAANLWLENIGIMQIMSSLIARGHRVSLIISAHPSRLVNRIVRQKPDVLAFSLTTNSFRWAINLAAAARRQLPGIRIIAGGAHPTLFPNFCEGTEIDAVCIGEGDEALGEWVEDLAGGGSGCGVPNIGYKLDGKFQYPELRPLLDPLDNSPFAYRTAFYQYRFFNHSPYKTFITSRGCVYGCRFCYNSRFREIFKNAGTYRRIMSPERVVAEIEQVRGAYPTRLVVFEDDCFPDNPDWIAEFARLYKVRVGLPFIINSRADLLNEDNVPIYKDAGVSTICMGVQCGSAEYRLKVLRTGIRDERIVAAADLLHRNGVSFLTYNMFGLPGETADDVYETILLNRRIEAPYGRFVMFQPYPGLPLTVEQGLSDESDVDIRTEYYRTIARKDENPEIVNLQNFSIWLLRHSATDRIVRFLARLPPNPAYKAIFWYTFLSALRRRRRLRRLELLRMILRNLL